MKVYILVHDEMSYEPGGMKVRGVYATEAAGLAALPREGTFRRLPDVDRHDAHCCSVDEWEVHAIPLTDPPHGD